MQKYSFINSYTYSSEIIKDFIFSDDYNAVFDELVKKFELNDEQELNLTYLLQDLVVRFLEPADVAELTYLIKQKNITKEEISGQLAHFIWTRFKPLVDKIWQEAESMEKEVKASKEEVFKDIIQKIKTQPKSKNIVNLEKVAQAPAYRVEFKSQTPNFKMKNNEIGKANFIAEKITKIETTPIPPSAVVVPQIQKEGEEPLKAKVINIEQEIETNPAPHIQPIPETELPSGQQETGEQMKTTEPIKPTQRQTGEKNSAIDLSNI